MMERKLAGFFAILAFAVLLGTWLFNKLFLEASTVSSDQLMVYAIMILMFYWLLGMFIARLGIGLVKEVIAEKRGREEEHRNRAKMRYEQVLDDGSEGGGPHGA